MKRSILLGIVGIAAVAATSTYGQGFIQLANYKSSAGVPPVMWGPGSGGTVGTPVNLSGFTVGFDWAAGNVVGSVAADPSATGGNGYGTAIPTSLFAGFASATGSAATAALVDSGGGYPGAYANSFNYQPGLGAGATLTVMLVAYNGASYGASTIRGHSLAFTMVTSVGTAFAQTTGAAETDGGFQVIQAVPEPTTMALGGLGLASLLLFRRKNA